MNLDTLARTVGDVADPSPDRLVAGRRQLDSAIDAAGVRVTVLRRRRQKRRWSISALAGAAAAAAAVLVVPLVGADPASAQEVLLAAADGAGQQANTAAGADYWYVVSEVDDPTTGPYQREIWQGRTAETITRDQFAAARAARATGATTLDPALVRTETFGNPATFVVGGQWLTWQDLDALPTDPGELGALLRAKVQGHPSGEDNELWESVTGMLRESPASPALRRALWQVAATIPGVQLLGAQTDAVGRRGTAVERNELDQGWYRIVYILNPADGTLLETKNIDKDGNVVSRLTELTQEPTDTAPAAQPPLCGPGSVPLVSC